MASSDMACTRCQSVSEASGLGDPSGNTCTTRPSGSSFARMIDSSFMSTRSSHRNNTDVLASKGIDDGEFHPIDYPNRLHPGLTVIASGVLAIFPKRIKKDLHALLEINAPLGKVLPRLPFIPLKV